MYKLNKLTIKLKTVQCSTIHNIICKNLQKLEGSSRKIF